MSCKFHDWEGNCSLFDVDYENAGCPNGICECEDDVCPSDTCDSYENEDCDICDVGYDCDD